MYAPVDKFPDFPGLERRVLELWRATRAFELLREQNRGGPRWSFLDGPITANNPMGVHHAWGRALKDMYQRYQRFVRRQIAAHRQGGDGRQVPDAALAAWALVGLGTVANIGRELGLLGDAQRRRLFGAVGRLILEGSAA